jgi:inhibitor of KinA sporulation pathway (predicted exonuclease)
MDENQKFISLDLEMNQNSGKIIQIGAVVGDLISGEIFEEIRLYVNPGEPLNPFIVNLTGITEEDILEKGSTLEEAYTKLSALRDRHNCYRNAIVWGGGDSEALRQQLNLNHDNFLFGRRWLDIKTIFQMYSMSQGLKLQAGLAKAMVRMGLQFKGKKHDALDDARNTFILGSFLLKKFRK